MKIGTLLADRRIFLTITIVLTAIYMGNLSEYFLNIDNLLSMTQYGAVIGLLALGQALVILGGEGGIDLSIGASLSLSGVFMGLFTDLYGVNPWIAAIIALAFGAFLGLVNGLLVSAIGIPPLIATLSTMYLYSSLANVVTGGKQFSGFDVAGFKYLGQGAILGIPVQVLFVLLPAFFIVIWATNYTRQGIGVYQIGTSTRASELVGINATRARIWLYVIAGICAALGAIVTNSWLLTARPSAGLGLELQAITIAVLGGIDIFGGKGRISGVLLGVLLVVIVNNGLQLGGVGNSIQIGILGAILVFSVVFNNLSERGFLRSKRHV